MRFRHCVKNIALLRFVIYRLKSILIKKKMYLHIVPSVTTDNAVKHQSEIINMYTTALFSCIEFKPALGTKTDRYNIYKLYSYK